MSRNKYSIKFENEMKKKAESHTFDKLLSIAIKKYKYDITKEQLMRYLSRRKIRYADYNPNKAGVPSNFLPIGSEYTKDDGMTLVKVSNDKWVYKQRHVYEEYHRVKLNKTDYIIFLDGDRTNFAIENLCRLTNREASLLANMNLPYRNAEITLAAIELAKSEIRIKELEGRKLTNHKKKRGNINGN